MSSVLYFSHRTFHFLITIRSALARHGNYRYTKTKACFAQFCCADIEKRSDDASSARIIANIICRKDVSILRLGFIGCGNMATAILGGVLKKGLLRPDEIIASALHQTTLDRVKETYHIHTTTDNAQAAQADIVILAVKPQFYEQVIAEIRDTVSESQIIVSIAPGKSIETITGWFGKNIKLIRTMPNTPAMVGEGVTAVCPSERVTDEQLREVLALFESCGITEIMPERLIDAVPAVSGSSPAYVFLFIEALADGAVRDGIPRQQAYRLAAQAVLGSAKMVLETGRHPGDLKDMVCSPAGTTIEAIAALEKEGFRSAVLAGMKACSDKTKEMR